MGEKEGKAEKEPIINVLKQSSRDKETLSISFSSNVF